ncbi:hypothetical protein [Azospirillum sp. sgz302134]
MTGSRTEIPLDPRNPGQVFAAVGLLELLDRIAPRLEPRGGFDLTGAPVFVIELAGNAHPVRVVLDALRDATVEVAPPAPDDATAPLDLCLPGGASVRLDLWAGLDSRIKIKTWAGQQTSRIITQALLDAIRQGIAPSDEALGAPFDAGLPLTGRFGFDPRSAWTARDAGYSPNEQGDAVQTYPLVELLAAVGLQEARPDRALRYRLQSRLLPAPLARAALAGALGRGGGPSFRFSLAKRGSYLFFEQAREESSP